MNQPLVSLGQQFRSHSGQQINPQVRDSKGLANWHCWSGPMSISDLSCQARPKWYIWLAVQGSCAIIPKVGKSGLKSHFLLGVVLFYHSSLLDRSPVKDAIYVRTAVSSVGVLQRSGIFTPQASFLEQSLIGH